MVQDRILLENTEDFDALMDHCRHIESRANS
jgi:hypothetical protein